MHSARRYTTAVAAVVALGGFLMGFDASVISGVVGFIGPEFGLSKLELGWSVASLTLTASLGMLLSGPLSDRYGRRSLLMAAATLFLVSALASALAPSFAVLVAARMLGGLGVGAALIVAPMYIAELAPARTRGRLVSLNQLNIVIGISAAFFSNYLVLQLASSEATWARALGFGPWTWRWMLGLEALPAAVYLLALPWVPESPRWLAMKGREREAFAVLSRATGQARAQEVLAEVKESTRRQAPSLRARLSVLFSRRLRRVLLIGLCVAVLQQITGINAVFFYAPMIFEQTGIGTDAAFLQAIGVGLTNLVFTIAALVLIDRIGRRPLLIVGVTGIVVSMGLLAYGFGTASYTLGASAIESLPETIDPAISQLAGVRFESDYEYRRALAQALGSAALRDHEAALVAAAIDMNPTLILLGILAFVASFAVSLGPVMWVLFSELFPNLVRAVAVSFVGLVNSAVSFAVQLVFPWALANLGNAGTFFAFGVFAGIGLLLIVRFFPETRGRSLEELEQALAPEPDPARPSST